MFWEKFLVSSVGLEDAQYYIWLLWHSARGFLGQNSLLFTNLLYYPHGATLVFDTPFLNTLVGLPFYLTMGPIAAYNFLIVFTFVTTFAGFYLFLNLLTKAKVPSILGALLFTFCSYRITMLSLGQIDLLSTEWIGFTLYFLFKYFDKANFGNKFLAPLSVFFALNAYTDYRTFIISLLIVGISLLLTALLRPKDISIYLNKLFKFALISLLLLLPLLFIHFRNFSLYPTFAEPDSPWLTSADILSYVYPFKNLTRYYFGLAIPFVGFLQLALVPLSFFVLRKDKIGRKTLVFWSLFALFFVFLSFGESLVFFGNRVYSSDFMPYTLIKNFPVLSFFRSPVRLSLGVNVAVAVLSTFALVNVFEKLKTNKSKTLFIIFVSFIAIFQNLPIIPKMQINKFQNSPVFEKLAEMGQGTVLYVPFGYMDAFSELNGIYDTNLTLSQLIHKKPIMGGYLSYVSADTVKDFAKDPFISKLIACEKNNNCTPISAKESENTIKKFNLKYVLIDKKHTNGNLTGFLEKSFGPKLITESSEFRLVAIPN